MDELRIVLADDHPVVRDGLCALLASVPGLIVVETVATGREAVRAAVTTAPDVLVLDIRMPDLDGVAAAGEIARVAPKTAVLMLTMFDDDSLFAAMRAGASGYVLKGATQDEIVRAIRAVAAGEAIFSPGIARRMLTYLTGPPRAADPFPELTPGSGRYSTWSQLGCRTPPSVPGWGWPPRPSATTPRRCSPSFTWPGGQKPSSVPARPVSARRDQPGGAAGCAHRGGSRGAKWQGRAVVASPRVSRPLGPVTFPGGRRGRTDPSPRTQGRKGHE